MVWSTKKKLSQMNLVVILDNDLCFHRNLKFHQPSGPFLGLTSLPYERIWQFSFNLAFECGGLCQALCITWEEARTSNDYHLNHLKHFDKGHNLLHCHRLWIWKTIKRKSLIIFFMMPLPMLGVVWTLQVFIFPLSPPCLKDPWIDFFTNFATFF